MAQEINNQQMLPCGYMLRNTYRIDRYLSSGGFGNTYVATNTSFNEVVAIKEFFLKGASERDNQTGFVSVSQSNTQLFDSQLQKFKKEAQRLRRLNNPHIVRVHDLFDENGTCYYVMDFIDGESLSEKMKRTQKPLSESEVMAILPGVLDALRTVHYSHDADSLPLLHLDIKPANLLVDRSGNVFLIDFGASKQISSEGGMTTTTAMCYTPGFAPLEQVDVNTNMMGPWTDFYALGATIYNLLTRKNPPTPSEIAVRGVSAYEFNRQMSDKMCNLILWCMNMDMNRRPRCVEDIEMFLFGNPRPVIIPQEPKPVVSEKKETQVLPKASTPQSKPVPNSISKPTSTNNIKSNRWIWIGLAFIVILILGIVLVQLLSSGKSSDGYVENDTTRLDSTYSNYYEDVVFNIAEMGGEYTYTGETNDEGLPNGHGQATFPNGNTLVCSFVDGKASGYGNLTFKNGDRVEGDFYGLVCKSGFRIYANGDMFKGTLDKQYLPVEGRYTKKDRTYFVGNLKNKKGIWYNADGTKQGEEVSAEIVKPEKENLNNGTNQDQPVKPSSQNNNANSTSFSSPEVQAEENVEENEIYEIAENMPCFPGGVAVLKSWLGKNIQYPAIAVENNIQGNVLVTFIINKDGSVVDAHVTKSVDPSLDREALRVIRGMPKWIPGTQGGKPVRVKLTMPINYRLN